MVFDNTLMLTVPFCVKCTLAFRVNAASVIQCVKGRDSGCYACLSHPQRLPRIFTLYSKSLPLDLACRIWDVFCRDGEEFLFRTALGILKLFEDILTRMDFIHSAQFLTRLPEDLPADEVFASIATVQMQSRNKKWAQVSGCAAQL